MINYFDLKNELTLEDIYEILEYFNGAPKKFPNISYISSNVNSFFKSK